MRVTKAGLPIVFFAVCVFPLQSIKFYGISGDLEHQIESIVISSASAVSHSALYIKQYFNMLSDVSLLDCTSKLCLLFCYDIYLRSKATNSACEFFPKNLIYFYFLFFTNLCK